MSTHNDPLSVHLRTEIKELMEDLHYLIKAGKQRPLENRAYFVLKEVLKEIDDK